MLQGGGVSVDTSVMYFEEFVTLTMNDASDLYLAIMTPLNQVPCVANSFQLRANFRKFQQEQPGNRMRERPT